MIHLQGSVKRKTQSHASAYIYEEERYREQSAIALKPINTMIPVACILLVLAACVNTAPVETLQDLNVPEPITVDEQQLHHPQRITTFKRTPKLERQQFIVRIPCRRDDELCSRSHVYEFDLMKVPLENSGYYGTSSRDYY